MELKITDADFDQKVLKAEKPVLVDFWAEWCGPCRMQNPILEELVKEIKGKAYVGKVNVDENSATAGKYGVMSIPTLMLFHKGEIVKQWIGVQQKESLKAEISKLIN